PERKRKTPLPPARRPLRRTRIPPAKDPAETKTNIHLSAPFTWFQTTAEKRPCSSLSKSGLASATASTRRCWKGCKKATVLPSARQWLKPNERSIRSSPAAESNQAPHQWAPP